MGILKIYPSLSPEPAKLPEWENFSIFRNPLWLSALLMPALAKLEEYMSSPK